MTIQKFGEIREYLHFHVADVFPVELTVYARPRAPLPARAAAPTASPSCGCGSRRSRRLRAEHGDDWRRYLAEGIIEGLEAAMAETCEDRGRPGSFDGLVQDDDLDIDLEEEEPCRPEPGEEDDPDQAYDSLPGFESL